jgi:hypothetical protein
MSNLKEQALAAIFDQQSITQQQYDDFYNYVGKLLRQHLSPFRNYSSQSPFVDIYVSGIYAEEFEVLFKYNKSFNKLSIKHNYKDGKADISACEFEGCGDSFEPYTTKPFELDHRTVDEMKKAQNPDLTAKLLFVEISSVLEPYFGPDVFGRDPSKDFDKIVSLVVKDRCFKIG